MADSEENYQLDLGSERVKSKTEITVNLPMLFGYKLPGIFNFTVSLGKVMMKRSSRQFGD